MAVRIYTGREIEKIYKAGQIAFNAHMELAKSLRVGISTLELDNIARDFIKSNDAEAAFLGFNGYPANICTSINDAVVHGIPSGEVKLNEGDIIGIDIGVKYEDYYADTAWSWPIGKISETAAKLLDTTQRCLYAGIKAALPGNRVGAIGSAVQELAEKNGFSVVRSLVGHGVGKSIHEEPQVPNYGRKKDGVVLKSGMVLAIEPMINEGKFEVYTDRDKWTVKTKDGKYSAHFEHTVAITANGPKICTLPENANVNIYSILEKLKG